MPFSGDGRPGAMVIVPRCGEQGGAGAAGTVAKKLDGARKINEAVGRCNGRMGGPLEISSGRR